MAPMYLDAMEFLEEEREAWRPYEALPRATHAQLDRPIDAVRGGRDVTSMVHLLAWLDIALAAAKELAVRDDSPTLERRAQDTQDRGVDALNQEFPPRRWPGCRTGRLR